MALGKGSVRRCLAHHCVLRLLGRLPRPTVYSTLEIVLLVLIAVQAARLLWILGDLVGPVGERKASGRLFYPTAMPPCASSILLPPLRGWRARRRHLIEPQALRRDRGPCDRPGFGDHRPARRHRSAASRSAKRSCRASRWRRWASTTSPSWRRRARADLSTSPSRLRRLPARRRLARLLLRVSRRRHPPQAQIAPPTPAASPTGPPICFSRA